MFTRDSVILSYNIKTPLTSISRAVGNILKLTFNAPYNLTVEFKMTNRLELNWELDGVIDEQRYYCSETTIDTTSLPTPKVILSGDLRAYIDTDIVENKDYHVIISSVKNGIEKLSKEVVVSTKNQDEYWENVICQLQFNNGTQDIVDDKGILSWSKSGSVSIVTDTTLFNSGGNLSIGSLVSDYIKSSTIDLTSINNSTSKFTIEFFFNKSVSGGNAGAVCIASKSGGSSDRTALFLRGPSSNFNAAVYSSNRTFLDAPSGKNNGQWGHFAYVKDGTANKLFIDGVLIYFLNSNEFRLYSDSEIWIGQSGKNSDSFGGLIDGLRITKDVARYSSNFLPPSTPY